jgi:peptidoglycan/LPS O-acetylase OafA/YrhL
VAPNGQETTDFVPALHGLRGIAALAVVLFHWYQFFPTFSQIIEPDIAIGTVASPATYLGFGWLGVPLFFILSGYLLGSKVLARPLTIEFLGRFWLRRFMRIYPAVWLHLTGLMVAAPLIAGLVAPGAGDSLALQFLLWINMPPQMQAPISNVLWTLPIELSFYCALPFIGVLSRRLHWVGLLLISLTITLSWRLGVIWLSDFNDYTVMLPYLDMLPGTLFTFMVGYCLNFLPGRLGRRNTVLGLTIAVLVFLALLQWQLVLGKVYWSGHWILGVWPPCVACALAAVVYFSTRPDYRIIWLGHPFMVWLGNISFGIYLWHYPILRSMNILDQTIWASPMGSLLALPVVLLLTLPIATMSYRFLERPLMGWRHS